MTEKELLAIVAAVLFNRDYTGDEEDAMKSAVYQAELLIEAVEKVRQEP